MPIFIYSQDTGNLYDSGNPSNIPIATGYSGAGAYQNDPASQCYQDLGPIPRGTYTIGPMGDAVLGNGKVLKNALLLTPDPANAMCGRAGFYIHGDNATYPGWASEGCIVIQDLAQRKLVNNAVTAGMDQLEVRQHFG